MPRILTKYIALEIVTPFLLSLGVLTSTAMLSRLIRLIEIFFTQGISPDRFFIMLVAIIPTFLVFTIPMSFLVGVLVAATRLSFDSEITAMKSSGVGLTSILKPVLLVAVFAFAASLLTSLYLFPWGFRTTERILLDIADEHASSVFEEQTFYDKFAGVTFYVDKVDKTTGELEGVLIASEPDEGPPVVIIAEKGVIARSEDGASVNMYMANGAVQKIHDDGSYRFAAFDSYRTGLGLVLSSTTSNKLRSNALTLPELFAKLQLAIDGNMPTHKITLDIHKRFAVPAAIFAFALIGLPLGLQKVRSAKFTGFGIAIAVIVIYYILTRTFESLGESAKIAPELAAWAPVGIMLVAGAWLFRRAQKERSIALVHHIGAAIGSITDRFAKRGSV
ncbi:MAG: LPS export ABC transporter permease LptF [Deltaproteobacteria bacterium]|nr:LPS export ABC transporter permease LptF [Deltaproteobacteria bacterium]